VCLGALPFLRLIGHFCHNNAELGYTHDSNRFSPKRHWCLVLFYSVYSRVLWTKGIHENYGNTF
jgi:hypothetical protein